MPDTVAGFGDAVVNKVDKVSVCMGLDFKRGDRLTQ